MAARRACSRDSPPGPWMPLHRPAEPPWPRSTHWAPRRRHAGLAALARAAAAVHHADSAALARAAAAAHHAGSDAAGAPTPAPCHPARTVMGDAAATALATTPVRLAPSPSRTSPGAPRACVSSNRFASAARRRLRPRENSVPETFSSRPPAPARLCRPEIATSSSRQTFRCPASAESRPTSMDVLQQRWTESTSVHLAQVAHSAGKHNRVRGFVCLPPPQDRSTHVIERVR